MRKSIAGLALLLVALTGCSNEIDPPSSSVPLPPQPETPRGVTASIGDRQAVLTWTVTNPAAIDHYVVYFSDSVANEMAVFDSTRLTSDTIDGLVNGQRYYFGVASVDTSGLEGEKSRAVSVLPGIFSIVIESGREYTSTRTVTISLTAPPGTGLVQLSEDSDFAEGYWQSFAASKGFELSDGDGSKTVYARFQVTAGGTSVGMVSDDVVLDRAAVIDSVRLFGAGYFSLPPDTVLTAGDIVHFAVYTSEDGQDASVDISGLESVGLNDYGIGGDALSGDRIYEADYIIPDETELSGAVISGRFADAAGNQASPLTAPQRLSVTSPPKAVTLWGFAVSSWQLQLQWTQSQSADFSRYRVFRADSALPIRDSLVVMQLIKATDTKYLDADLDEQKSYCYWVYVDDTHGNSARSQTFCLSTLQNEYPDSVTIIANTTTESLTAKISWPKDAVAPDFEAYHVLRSPQAFSTYADSLVIDFINDQKTTTYTDRSIPVIGDYYYRVYVVDRQGLKSPSNLATVNIPR